MIRFGRLYAGAALLAVLVMACPLVVAQDAAAPMQSPAEDEWDWLAKVAEGCWIVHNGQMPKTKAPPVENERCPKTIPISWTIEYALSTDHVWRGINFSEYSGEGREDLNHQLGLAAELNTKGIGVFGAAVWFNWFAGLEELTGGSVSCEPLENDYTVYWRHAIDPLAMMLEIGWSYIAFPEFSGDLENTHELYVRMGFDDSHLWGTKRPVLNPYVFYAFDYDAADNGQWLEFGIKPKMVMADWEAMRNVPILREMWISPSLALGIDHRYYGGITQSAGGLISPADKTTKFANLVYGVEVGYNLGRALGMAKQYGDLTVVGFLNFSQAFEDKAIDDELWGGVKVGFSW